MRRTVRRALLQVGGGDEVALRHMLVLSLPPYGYSNANTHPRVKVNDRIVYRNKLSSMCTIRALMPYLASCQP